MKQLIKHFGSQTALAKILNVDRAAVSQWLVSGIPPKRAIEIEELTQGKFKAVDLVRGDYE